jgi:hypothetical protein
LYRPLSGIHSRMTDTPMEDMDPAQQERERDAKKDDDLLEEQEGKGFGEDEGERDEALPE